MQPFSGYLTEALASLPLDKLSPAERQRVIRAYAKHFRVPETDVATLFDELAKQTRAANTPLGVLPTTHNLDQPDLIHAARRSPTRADQVLSVFDQTVANLGGAGQRVPYVRELANPLWAVLDTPMGWINKAQNWGYSKLNNGRQRTGFIGGMLLPTAGQWVMYDQVGKGLEALAGKVPHGIGTRVLHPWSSFFGSAKIAKYPKLAAIGKLGLGSLVDVGQGVYNTGYDIYEGASGKKAKRYTDAVRQAIGYNADPWEAALAHQGKVQTDQVLDHTKAAIQAALGGNTHGMVSMLGGGSRIHMNMNPISMLWGGYDPLLMGNTNKDLLKYSLLPGLKGNIARRKIRYRYRDGFTQGLGKDLAGEYFNYEHDVVDKKINQERKDFRLMSDLYTLEHNPDLFFRMADTTPESSEEKKLLSDRYKWMKDTKLNKKTVYDAAADNVGADKRTLA